MILNRGLSYYYIIHEFMLLIVLLSQQEQQRHQYFSHLLCKKSLYKWYRRNLLIRHQGFNTWNQLSANI